MSANRQRQAVRGRGVSRTAVKMTAHVRDTEVKAKKTITTTEFTDDLDRGAAAGTVAFSFGNASYEIDLSKRNRNAMEKALKPYIDHARKARSSRSRRAATSSASRRTDLAAVRARATDNGFEVSERGRISQEVTAAYYNLRKARER